MFHFKRISYKLLGIILPIVIVALVSVTAICCGTAMSAIEEQTAEEMSATIDANCSEMVAEIQVAETTTKDLATMVEKTLDSGESIAQYDDILKAYVEDSDLIIALGIFMNPDAWDGDIINEYVCLDGSSLVAMDLTDTDLTETEWYIHCQTNGTPFYTETYVDTTLNVLMTSYVVPFFDKQGNFLGVINTDIDMSPVQSIVENMQAGETGRALLISKTGMYLSGVSDDQILTLNIARDTDSGMAAIATDIFGEGLNTAGTDEELTASYAEATISSGYSEITRDGVDYTIYYEPAENYDWIVLLEVESAELTSVVDRLSNVAITISVVAILICAVIIYMLARSISKPIIAVKDMSQKMAEGDFSQDKLARKTYDEVGVMTDSLNNMLESNRNEMLDISDNSKIIGENCEILKQAVTELEESFQKINGAIHTISGAMMDNSATTQELTASVTEVKEVVSSLANKANESEEMSRDIMNRAHDVGTSSAKSFEYAMNLSSQFETRLNSSIENSKVVNDIETMADAILEIAEQINLLSLNASIEAARAGEHGKGFAVVAGEIGNLASQTSNTVSSIQATVAKVKESVDVLAKDSKAVITFITDNVNPDYQLFVDTSNQYEADAKSLQDLATYVANVANQLKSTMEDVNTAIANIATASQDAALESTVILENVDNVTGQVANVGDISAKQKDISDKLDAVVGRYKLQ